MVIMLGSVLLTEGITKVVICWFVAGVMDVAIVERGRNVVSASRDGTARLWDCGKSACLAKYAAESVINGCSLHTPAADIDLLQPDHAPGIVLTAASVTHTHTHTHTHLTALCLGLPG